MEHRGAENVGAIEVVALAASAGGIEAVTAVLQALTSDFPAAVVILMHLQTSRLVGHNTFSKYSRMPVEFFEPGKSIQRGRVYVAPPGQAIELEPDGTATLVPHRNADRPIDATLGSIAQSYAARALAVILTGMRDDGARGVRQFSSRKEARGRPGSSSSGANSRFALCSAVGPIEDDPFDRFPASRPCGTSRPMRHMTCTLGSLLACGLLAVLVSGCAAAPPDDGSIEGVQSAVVSDRKSDLWISVLSPPVDSLDAKMLGAYVHCPSRGRAKVDLYEFAWGQAPEGGVTLLRRLLASLDAVVETGATRMALFSDENREPAFRFDIDTRDGHGAPFMYDTELTLDPLVYVPTALQRNLIALKRNPAYPEYVYQPVWGTDLSSCGE